MDLDGRPSDNQTPTLMEQAAGNILANPTPKSTRRNGTMTSTAMPPFWCPLEAAMNPAAAETERRAIAWADSVGLCRTETERARLVSTSSAEFYSRFAPHADPHLLTVAACWVYWGFAFDDVYCDDGPGSVRPAEFAAAAGLVQRCLETPGGRDLGQPYAAAIHDLGERFRAVATPAVVRRFINAHCGWLAGVQWQIANQSCGCMPELDDYLTMRLHSAGGEPTFELLEIANGIEVPADEIYAPRVVALTEMAILVAALDNDRYSYAKERHHKQADQNIINVFRHQDYPLD